MPDVQGIVLAAGMSSRMGFPKALMPIGSSFFLLDIYKRLVESGARPVHVVINVGLRSSLEAQVAKFPEARFVLNDKPAKGQIHSLQLGLQAAADNTASAAMVALVDQPLLRPKTIKTLLERAAASPEKVIIPQVQGKHGHPIVIPRTLFDAFLLAAEGKTAEQVLHEHASWVEYVEVDDPSVVTNINSPEDLVKLQAAADDEMD